MSGQLFLMALGNDNPATEALSKFGKTPFLSATWGREGGGRHPQGRCPSHICDREHCPEMTSGRPPEQAFQWQNYCLRWRVGQCGKYPACPKILEVEIDPKSMLKNYVILVRLVINPKHWKLCNSGHFKW